MDEKKDKDPVEKAPFSLSRAWESVKGFGHDNKTPLSIALLSSVLLGTTALSAPFIATTIGAGAVLATSLYLLTKSGDVLIDSVSDIGEKFNVSPLMLGLGLGAMASVPELFVAINSIASGAREIGIGQVVGANIAHVFLILGATAAIGGIAKGKGLGWKFNTLAMAGTTLGFGAALASGVLTPIMGAGMLALAGLYLGGIYYVSKKDSKTLNVPAESLIHSHAHGKCSSHDHDHSNDHDHDDHDHGHEHSHDHGHAKKTSAWLNWMWGATGMASLIFSAHVAVDSASNLALNTGVSEATVGALGIALGVSMPELTISIKAALKNKTDMAIGNILGCNIFNILFVGSVLGLAGTVVPDSFSTVSTLGKFNLAALGASAGLMTATLLANKGGMKKWQGYSALGLYAAYIATSIALGGHSTPEKTIEEALATEPAPVVEMAAALPPPDYKYQ